MLRGGFPGSDRRGSCTCGEGRCRRAIFEKGNDNKSQIGVSVANLHVEREGVRLLLPAAPAPHTTGSTVACACTTG